MKKMSEEILINLQRVPLLNKKKNIIENVPDSNKRIYVCLQLIFWNWRIELKRNL